MEEAHAPVTVLASLREYGLRLMLDDFGTGYSSLAYLKRFPLDVLKIDRSFVAGLGRDEEDSAIVAAIVQMARTLGLTVVAEGVERPEQLERLRELGCDRVQGRLIAEPMPAADVERHDGRGAAQAVTQRVFDGHNDALSRIARAGPDALAGFLAGDGEGHLDLPRAQRGGLAGGCFAVFTCSPAGRGRTSPAPTSRRSSSGARSPRRWRRSRCCCGSSARRAGACASCARPRPRRSLADLVGARWLAAVLHLEGAEPIGPALDELEVLHAAGVRSLGLVWSRPNAFATGVPFGFPGSPDQGPGLTGAGRELVRACAALGILVDLSHLNARGFWDVAELSDGAARRLALRRPRALPVAAQPHRRPAARDRRERRPRRDQLPRRLPARGRRRGRRHAARDGRRARGARRRDRRRRCGRPRLRLRRRDDARAARRRHRPAGCCSTRCARPGSATPTSPRSRDGNWRRVLRATWPAG